MEVKEMGLDALKPYGRNPRINDGAVDYVANSILEFGFKVPIVVDRKNVIVAGHTRYKAAKKLGLETVPCIVADDLTDEQVRAFRLADNKVGEIAEWDFDVLSEELDEIIGFDMSEFGFAAIESESVEAADKYTQKTNIPQYEPTGEEVEISCLADLDKYEELIGEIQSSGCSEKEKDFLRLAATRHIVFDYTNIAEYYANAPAETQKLMEDSALVIIDINDAIAGGYTVMSDAIAGIMGGE